MTTSESWQIVLIDDEEDIREVMTLTLQDAGYRVETAADGESGLKLCNEFCPRIVITDIRMPGMDGLQVLEALKKNNPDIEVIVATAFGEMDLAISALQLDASDFVTKPISDQALYLALKRARERFNSRKQLKDYTSLLEKEKAETSQELLKSIAFQRNLIESSMDGILGCNDKNIVVTYNQCMEQMLGYTKQEVLHKMTLSNFFSRGEYLNFNVEFSNERYGGNNKLMLYETTLKGKYGQKIPVQISATALFDQDKAHGLVCFFRDLREIRRLEREMEDQARILHQDKMMSLGRLAASVVHEINNPLSGVLNYFRLMIRILGEERLDENQKKKFIQYLELVENETKRCSQIVSSLLNFSRISPPAFQEVRIEELINRCIILSQHKLELSHIHLQSNIQTDIPPVRGDFNQLQQCMINLIFNAIDAMPKGGTLMIEGRHQSEERLALIAVTDSGQGIASADLPYIFEPFFTTKKEAYGVGLGLSTVYGIIERHKGTVVVKSRPGEGATFILKLPVTESQTAG
ncbi:MAG: response regulator [Deltaproteobacteria bacterium]|jgi:PAS domain S-box-containing protein|nr:response regulator [Deltaproteobacteria bacterium]